MKAEIHPKLNPVVFVDSACGAEFVTISTMSSKTTKKINGVDHYVLSVDISSASHPFYTGKQTLIDTAGRVDKFRARMEASKKMQEGAKAGKTRKEVLSKETPEEKISRKAKENTEKKEAEKIEAKKPAPAKKATPAKKVAPVKKAPAKKATPAKKAPAKKKA
jgi:large subunit ribosomal protein L31